MAEPAEPDGVFAGPVVLSLETDRGDNDEMVTSVRAVVTARETLQESGARLGRRGGVPAPAGALD